MNDDIVIPASYDVWLTDLKHHLDRTPGSKAALARYLESCRGLKPASAKVKVSELLRRRSMPGADLFIDIAAWLQQETTRREDPMRLERHDEPEPVGPRTEVRYTTGSTRQPAKVAEQS